MRFRLRLLALVLAVFVAPAMAQPAVEPPVPIRTVAPEYPHELKQIGIAGVVVVICTVDEEGNVKEPEVQKSTHSGFNRAAVDAVRRWKFKPAKQNGAPVARKISIPVKFVAEG